MLCSCSKWVYFSNAHSGNFWLSAQSMYFFFLAQLARCLRGKSFDHLRMFMINFQNPQHHRLNVFLIWGMTGSLKIWMTIWFSQAASWMTILKKRISVGNAYFYFYQWIHKMLVFITKYSEILHWNEVSKDRGWCNPQMYSIVICNSGLYK